MGVSENGWFAFNVMANLKGNMIIGPVDGMGCPLKGGWITEGALWTDRGFVKSSTGVWNSQPLCAFVWPFRGKPKFDGLSSFLRLYIYIYTGPFGAYIFFYRFPQSLVNLVNIKPSVSWYPKIQWFNASFAPLKLPSIRGIQSIWDTQIIPNHLTGWYHYITLFWLTQMIKKHIIT